MRKKSLPQKSAVPLVTSSILTRQLLDWHHQNPRPLPWRENRSAYRIWISEVMLQQTTSQAVIPYFKRFTERFPTVQSLAKASIEDVYEQWAGLGYYSRARNLHKAAQVLAKKGFPKTFSELIELPGFGPYTSRAVSSLAFGEPVGVLDGNVIRVLSRHRGEKIQWWKTLERSKLQAAVDELAQIGPSDEVNSALMDLGATICTPQSPSCLLCPWRESCRAQKLGLQNQLPLKKPKTEGQILLWRPQILIKNNKIALTENNYAPFLKKAKIFPGKLEILKKKPQKFSYKHSITRYDIYIDLPMNSSRDSSKNSPRDLSKNPSSTKVQTSISLLKASSLEWVPLSQIKKQAPYNLLLKALRYLDLPFF